MQEHFQLFASMDKEKCKNKGHSVDECSTWYSIKNQLSKFPNETTELMPGVTWGNYNRLYTPAFWKFQYLLSNYPKTGNQHRSSNTIIEEIVFCMLGGYGIPSEMGIKAYHRIKEHILGKQTICHSKIFRALDEPFFATDGRPVRYRFAKQKSLYLYKLLSKKNLSAIPQDCDIKFRNWLLDIDGIGFKTASWITRNWLKSDKVAILDIHLLRAGSLTGFFDHDYNVNTQYLKLEKQYLNFCTALEVPASDMDAIIWFYMKSSNRMAIKHLNS